ncbi:DUF4129 domain-containing protein [Ornithinimicrobium pratense]|uniref:DUF4129 domain-containing protein n=1 Tax=Ornithinimicrobium pratense TaxID=2593973 RepID=A0A5J6V494_9MICO|nr:DUF4129 domain-containing protein [Ornithinimicrobium pratense]QFG67952.1 DUF4129 domain-containing protein [Ornithinimicrobium pratense]
MRRGMTSTVVVTVLLAVGGLLLLVWSSSSGSPLVGAPQGTWGPPPITMQAEPPVDLELETLPPEQAADSPDGPDLNQWIVDAVQLLLLLTLVFGLLHVLRRLLEREKREGTGPPREREEELAALLDASGEEVRYRALTQGDPRNAVVACWVALEDAVQRSGLDQDPSQTASELTGEVLTRWEVDPLAIRDLAAAYREARFSRHPITEGQRRAAVDALERIHHDLRRKVKAEQEAREAREATDQTAAQAVAGEGTPAEVARSGDTPHGGRGRPQHGTDR